MEHAHLYGIPEQILQFGENSEIKVNDGPLKQMLDHQDVKDRKIVVFSIIGAFRRGKSFFLDYCLRFLYANYTSINQPNDELLNPQNWMGDSEECLKGFSWRSGSSRDTTGILMWNDVFLHTDKENGEKIAIIIIDTQGLFDNETVTKDNSRIFALGTLISSIQVLNLSGLIQEDQLQYLQFASEFAKFATSDNFKEESGKPFQNLLFLIRDWQYPNDYEYGTKGGQKYLGNILKTKQNQNEELKSVRHFVHNSFEKLDCALLPHPGQKVAVDDAKTGPYNGSWGGMNDNFKEILAELIENLLSPEMLECKKISGNELTCSVFKEYVLQYFNLFQSDKLPETKSIYETTIEKYMEMFTSECIDEYKKSIVEHQNLITTVEQIEIFHGMSKYKTLAHFNESRKMGSKSHANQFKETLESEIIKYFLEWSDKISYKIKRENEDRERARLALEDENKVLMEKLEIKLIEAQKQAEMEKEKLTKEIEYKETIQEKEIKEVKLIADHERTLRDETGKYSEEKQKMIFNQLESKLMDAGKYAEIEKEKLKKEGELKDILKQKEIEAVKLKAEHDLVLQNESGKYSEEKLTLLNDQLQSKLSDIEKQAELKRQNAEKDIAEMKSKLEQEQKLRDEVKEQQRIITEEYKTKLIETQNKAEFEKEKLKNQIQLTEIKKQKEIDEEKLKTDHERKAKDEAMKQSESKLMDAEKRAEIEMKKMRKESELKEILKQKEIDAINLKAEHDRKLREEAGKYSEENKKFMLDQLQSKLNDFKKEAEFKRQNAEKDIAEMKSKLEQEQKLKDNVNEHKRIITEEYKTKLIETQNKAEIEKEKFKRQIQITEIEKQKLINDEKLRTEYMCKAKDENLKRSEEKMYKYENKLADAEKRAESDREKTKNEISELRKKYEDEYKRRCDAEEENEKLRETYEQEKKKGGCAQS